MIIVKTYYVQRTKLHVLLLFDLGSKVSKVDLSVRILHVKKLKYRPTEKCPKSNASGKGENLDKS